MKTSTNKDEKAIALYEEARRRAANDACLPVNCFQRWRDLSEDEKQKYRDQAARGE